MNNFDLKKDFISACPPDPKDRRDLVFGDYIKARQIPSVVEWFFSDLEIKDQGETATCVGQSCSYMKEIQERVEHKDQFFFDGFRLYDECKKVDEYSGDGTYIRVAMKILADAGLTPIKIIGTNNVSKSYKISSYAKLEGIEDMKYALTATGPIVVGVEVFDNFSNVGQSTAWKLPTPSSKSLGGHAIVITGFNDFTQSFRFTNSWGLSWGNKGSALLPYSLFDTYIHTAWAGVDKNDSVAEGFLNMEKLTADVKKAHLA